MRNHFHQELLQLIKNNSGKATQHTFSDSYLGNTHLRYAITAPILRRIAREWMRNHKTMTVKDFTALLTSLIEGKSCTEKCFAGILMGYSTHEQRSFDPILFDGWLNHVEGWAEVDALCTGDYTITHILTSWRQWKSLLIKFSKDENINKRRASLVLLCSPLRNLDDIRLAQLALRNVESLKAEKHILISKAISWVLRSMVKHHRKIVSDYLALNKGTLPAIAVRETIIKLKTGKKH
jgi:3-methyladenine DNA glycosylase AlkD